MTSYRLSEHEVITVVSATPAGLHVQAEYAPGGRPPPMHWHPAQVERFTIVVGIVRVVAAGQVRDAVAGDEVVIAAGTAHRMWNRGPEPARVEWITEPAGRTLEWFALVSDLAGPDGRRRDVLGLLAGLSRYGDVFRLSTRPRWLGGAALALAGPLLRALTRKRAGADRGA